MPMRGRINPPNGGFFFVTTTVVNFLNIFRNEKACDILINIIKYYQQIHKFRILGYVIMPSHLHLILEALAGCGTISDIMRDIKKYSAWDIMDLVAKNRPEYQGIFQEASSMIPDQKRKFWMKRFHDEIIRNEKMFWTKLHYIHNNPVKAGLVSRIEDYKYSSARNYMFNDHSVIEVNTTLAGIEMR